jgi:redox-sensitive bicupin YhaK (pirin superfamily)
VKVWAGSYKGITSLPPPPNTYSANPSSNVHVLYIKVAAGEEVELEQAQGSNRTIYIVEGDAISVEGENVKNGYLAELNCGAWTLVNSSDKEVEVLYLAGVPIGMLLFYFVDEPVVQHGPFVMNSQQEIEEAFQQYRVNQFGGWPWKSDEPVFGKEMGRFLDLNGQERQFPPK